MIRETLEAMRAQLIATLQVLDVALAAFNIQEPCAHERKINVSTMTEPGKWYCPTCQAQWTDNPAGGGADHA